VLGALTVPAVLLATLAPPYQSSVEPLSPPLRQQLRAGGFWKQGCPVPMSGLRVLTVTHKDFRGRAVQGQLIVNRSAARPLARVFGKLYALNFPIRHLNLDDVYGPRRGRPDDGDVSGSFECRQAVPSPCSGGSGTGSWSNHAFGLAVDINPVENPYVGCGASYDRRGRRFLDRSVHREGMVTRKAIAAFASVGWGWGGSWSGNTKDYMHFSVNGH
jgi:D-alanyl-D-alanine carboxypeptidase